MHDIVFLDRGTVASKIKIRQPKFTHHWQQFDRTNESEIVDRAKHASIIINNKVPLRKEVLAQLPQLKLIAISATGYDCVDIDYCKRNHIRVCNIRDYARHTVPEHVFALLLNLRRSIKAYSIDVANGEWQKSQQFCFFNHDIKDLAHSNLVIMGSGAIGQSVASIARAFGMNVYFCLRKNQVIDTASPIKEGYVSWDEALNIADVISLHCPLNSDTKNMLSLADFKKMQRKPILINTARGGLVNENDLEIALHDNLLSAAGFDVAEQEPCNEDSPLMRLLERPNFILTPHIAWASEQAQQSLCDQLINNIENFVAGHPTNLIE